MKLRSLAVLIASTALASVAGAQQTPAPKGEQPGIEKPKAPTKPVVPSAKAATPRAAPGGAGAQFAPELQSLSAEARTFTSSKLSAMTPALRVRAATKATGGVVGLSEIPQTWIATAGNPSTPYLWLGGKGVNLVTGPDVEPVFLVGGSGAPEQGVWVQFNAEAGIRYVLVCDLTSPARWDLVVDSRSRAAMTVDTETRGIALIQARPASSYQRVLLVVARPLQTGPGTSVMEALRRCEVTAIRG
jgi:hypothetical protein